MWNPAFCKDCKLFGHSYESCKRLVKTEFRPIRPVLKEVDSSGLAAIGLAEAQEADCVVNSPLRSKLQGGECCGGVQSFLSPGDSRWEAQMEVFNCLKVGGYPSPWTPCAQGPYLLLMLLETL
ncbi:hypothetical protein Nepgr_004819 [Nepenthes gracilis]|uniref:Uncharacterized protein n=1 Tax=Nepenthes gracilis TaxID=150966 RepID=A0AAD3S233_NEPGR|nr:hypothetical protein Nepgr_004819 [Nepenthes gracilis]